MPRNTLIALFAATLIGAGALAPAEAATVSLGGPVSSPEAQASIVPAAYQVVKHKRIYHRSQHGPRFNHRQGRYVHFYRGYWYATPWWRHRGPVVAFRVVPRHSRRHVEWCFAHHPTYNPRTNLFTARSGLPYRCTAPIA